MARTADSYTATRKARAISHRVEITFAYGLGLTGPMDLSVAQLEMMLARNEITGNARCTRCSEHVVDCQEIGRYLVEWPAGWSWREA